MTEPFSLSALLLASSALVSGDLPLADRLRVLSPMFSPPPGAEVEIHPREVRDLGKKIAPGRLRGTIVVTPPRGHCLTIRRRIEAEDIEVCKRTPLTFTVDDLDKAGRLQWQVVTGDGDFGTPLEWRSPYRVAVIMPYGRDAKKPPTYKYIRDCRADVSRAIGRRVTVHLFSGETWTLRFPDNDDLLPQPDPIPNLVIELPSNLLQMSLSGKDGEGAPPPPPAPGNEAPAAPAKDAPPPKSEEHAPKAEHEGGGAGGDLANMMNIFGPGKDRDDRKVWAIGNRGAYRMSADHFESNGAVAASTKGDCHYVFGGSDEDPDTGRIECHDTAEFAEVFLPLTCLKDIRKKGRGK